MKDTKEKLEKYVKVDAPQLFNKVEKKVQRADHDIKEFKKTHNKELYDLSIELSEKFEEAQKDIENTKKTLSQGTTDLETLVKKSND